MHMMKRLLGVGLAAALTVGGCAGQPPAVRETRTPRGTPMRVELGDAEEEGDQISPEELAQRLSSYRLSAATRPTIMLRTDRTGRARDTATFDPFVARGCPPEGNARGAHNQAQNRL